MMQTKNGSSSPNFVHRFFSYTHYLSSIVFFFFFCQIFLHRWGYFFWLCAPWFFHKDYSAKFKTTFWKHRIPIDECEFATFIRFASSPKESPCSSCWPFINGRHWKVNSMISLISRHIFTLCYCKYNEKWKIMVLSVVSKSYEVLKMKS